MYIIAPGVLTGLEGVPVPVTPPSQTNIRIVSAFVETPIVYASHCVQVFPAVNVGDVLAWKYGPVSDPTSKWKRSNGSFTFLIFRSLRLDAVRIGRRRVTLINHHQVTAFESVYSNAPAKIYLRYLDAIRQSILSRRFRGLVTVFSYYIGGSAICYNNWAIPQYLLVYAPREALHK